MPLRGRRAGFTILGSVAILVVVYATVVALDIRQRVELTRRAAAPGIDALVHLHSVTDIERARGELIHLLWEDEGLPDRLPRVEPDIADGHFSRLRNLERIDRLTIDMDWHLQSIAYLFRPEQANGRLVLYHQGHRGGFERGKTTIGALLRNGYAVIALSMPLVGMNPRPRVELPEFGSIRLTGHESMHLLQPAHGHPLRYFFEPVAVVVNYAEALGYRSVAMVGLSGGGWTTTVYAALDPRITQSFAVAGSLPMYLRSDTKWGDWEQVEPELYRIANYLDLYLMGAAGRGRSQVQILNRLDPCCFWGDGYRSYLPALTSRAAAIGDVDYSLWVDPTNLFHRISPRAMKKILSELAAG